MQALYLAPVHGEAIQDLIEQRTKVNGNDGDHQDDQNTAKNVIHQRSLPSGDNVNPFPVNVDKLFFRFDAFIESRKRFLVRSDLFGNGNERRSVVRCKSGKSSSRRGRLHLLGMLGPRRELRSLGFRRLDP